MNSGNQLATIKVLTKDGNIVDLDLFCHIETEVIAGTTYYTLKTTSADTAGATFSASTASTGKIIMTYGGIGSRFVFRLTGIVKILSGTINAVYRAYTGGGTVNGVIDILIRRSDGTVRTTIATSVSPSANWGTTWATYTGASYSFAEYTVVDDNDYLEVDYFANVTARKTGQYCYLRVDDQTLSIENQTRTTGWNLQYGTPPTVSTLSATDVTWYSARMRGEITSTGGLIVRERGFEWGFQSGDYPYSWTETGTFDVGTFSRIVGGLPPGTRVYFRAKARNGAGWGYGSEFYFDVPTATLLKFSNRYLVSSTERAQTSSGSLVDDPYASITFTLSEKKTVLVIYQSNNVYGSSLYTSGIITAINIDGTDYSISIDSPGYIDYCARNTAFWVGELGAGSHTVKGRFASGYDGTTVTIDNRVLIVMIFDGNTFIFIDDPTQIITTSSAFIDDPYASATFTPPSSCKALIMYNVTNTFGVYETYFGKKIAINIDGTDYAQVEKGVTSDGLPKSLLTTYVLSLTAVSKTIKGRFASNNPGSHTKIDRRQFAVLLFDDSTLIDLVDVVSTIYTISGDLVDDTPAVINRTTTDERELLVVAVGTKRNGTSSSEYGECYGINIDGVDRAHSRSSTGLSFVANSASTAYAIRLSAGSHTVKGRFASNVAGTTAVINARVIVALWFYVPPVFVETITANNFPMLYLSKPVKAQEVISKVEGATITKVAKDLPEKLVKKSKAQELRSKF